MTVLKRNAVPLLVLLLVALVAGGTGYLTKDTSPRLGSTALPEAPSSGVRGTVRELNGNRLTLADGDRLFEVTLADNAPVESLRTGATSDLRVGDWLNVGSIPNEVTFLSLSGLIVIPQTLVVEPK